jgi:2-polyprenyl-6-methoxyphenol hydroxylase-like FAD-dependent oxidoreductase
MTQADILVRGAGAVGLAAALALSRQGRRVALLRSAPPAVDDVRAYALNAASVRLLATLKVWDAIPADARTAVHDMHVAGDAAVRRWTFRPGRRASANWPGSWTRPSLSARCAPPPALRPPARGGRAGARGADGAGRRQGLGHA